MLDMDSIPPQSTTLACSTWISWAARVTAFMPAGQGVVKWPTTRPALSALVDENELPLPDNAVDRVLLVHALEMSAVALIITPSLAYMATLVTTDDLLRAWSGARP